MAARRAKAADIKSFALASGEILAGKYEVRMRLGRGWEGEVYQIRELATGIDRAAKLFFPRRNVGIVERGSTPASCTGSVTVPS